MTACNWPSLLEEQVAFVFCNEANKVEQVWEVFQVCRFLTCRKKHIVHIYNALTPRSFVHELLEHHVNLIVKLSARTFTKTTDVVDL